jgi:hypothetical protein
MIRSDEERSTQAFGDVRRKAPYQCDLLAGEPARRVGAMQAQHTPGSWRLTSAARSSSPS